MSPSRSQFATLAGALAVWVAAGCAFWPRESPSVLRVVLANDVLGWIPHGPIPSEAHTLQLNAHVLQGLVRFDRGLRITPALAEGWESPDERTHVFYLRPDLHFSDGRPLSAEDVAASLDVARDAAWGTQDAFQAIESVRALDERRVEIRTTGPYLPLMQTLHLGFVLPREELTAPEPRTLGAGPYALSEWRPGQGFSFARNDHYHGAPPEFARVDFEVVQDPDERVERLLQGRADVLTPVPLARVATLRERADVEVRSGPGIRVLYLGLRVDRPPFSDPRVREAVALAMDRAALVEGALLGMGEPAHQLVPGAVVGYDPSRRHTRPDLERARELLAAAGHPDGLEVRLDGPRRHYANDVEILSELSSQLARIGIRALPRPLEKQAFFQHIDAGESDMHLVGWACVSGQGSDLLEGLLHSPGEQRGAWNSFGLADPGLDETIAAVRESRTAREFNERLRLALGEALELRALVPLVVQPEAIAFREGLHWNPSIDFSLWVPDFSSSPGG